MSDTTKKLYRAALSATVVLSLVSAVCIFISIRAHYDATIQHFERGAILPAVGMILAAAAVLPAAVLSVFTRIRDGSYRTFAEYTLADTVIRLLTAAVMLANFVSSVMHFYSGSANALETAAAILAFASAVALAAQALAKKIGSGIALLSFFPLLWAVVSMLSVYFDSGFALNSPIKSMALIIYIYMMIFFIGEARFMVEKQTLPFYVFISLASLASAALIFPMAVNAFCGGVGVPVSPAEALTAVAVWLLALSRALHRACSQNDVEPEREAEGK